MTIQSIKPILQKKYTDYEFEFILTDIDSHIKQYTKDGMIPMDNMNMATGKFEVIINWYSE